MDGKYFECFQSAWPTGLPQKRIILTGLVVLMLLFAGCGSNSDGGGTQTIASETSPGEIPTSTGGTPAGSSGTQTSTSGTPTSTSGTLVTSETPMSTSGTPITPSVTPTSTNGTSVTPSETPTSTSGTPTSTQSTGTTTETQTDTATSTTVASPTTQVDRTTSAEGLDVTVKSTTGNPTGATLILHATVTDALASDGIESITADTGGGLDLSNVTVMNVRRVGIDNGGTLPGNQIDSSLVANVERGIKLADGGERLTVPFDGDRNIESGDEIIVVIEGGIATDQPGTYSFSLTVNNEASQTARYNLTSSTP